MKFKWVLAASAAIVALHLSSTAQAFECPKHFASAQAAIDEAAAAMKDMADTMSKENMALVHALVDDAKMLLESAKHNHEKPQGAYDHARALAKADAARGHAEAAAMLHAQYMKM